MFGKCWDRIQAQGRFVICEYSWLEQDRNGQFAHIMNQMYISVQSRFDNFLVQQEIKDIEKYQNDLNKNPNKKKKKKGKKKGVQSKDQKADQSEHQQINFNDKKSQGKPSEEKSVVSNLVAKNVQQKKQDLDLKKQQQNLVKQNSEQIEINDKRASNAVTSGPHIEQTKEISKKEGQKQASQISSFKQKSDSCTDISCKIQNSSQKIVEQSDEKDTQKEQQRHTTKTTQYEQKQFATDKASQVSQQSQLSTTCLKLKPKSRSLSKPSLPSVSMKKLQPNLHQQTKKQKQQKQLQIIMGNAMQCHAKILTEESEKFQHTRKAAVDLLRQFLNSQQIKCKWQLVMFGSCEVGYALKQSDIDLVLRIENPKLYSLKTMQQVLKFYPWILQCQYISTANVPIITLKMNLYQAKKLSNRLLKKLDKCQSEGENILQFAQDFIVTVDISICSLKQQYGGVVSSNNLRFLFYQNQSLKKMVFILKDLLRRKQLNKTYRGGVNSYVLTMMIYGIIKKKQLQLTKSTKSDNQHNIKRIRDYLQSLRTNLYIVFCEISNYLKDFVSFQTLINPLDENIQGQKDIHLNIVDPFSKKLVKTSAFRIDDIIEEVQAMRIFLDAIKDEIKVQELDNKKIKFQIFQKILDYMGGIEPSSVISS